MMVCVCVDKKTRTTKKCYYLGRYACTKQTQQIAKQISPQRFYEITGHRLSPSYGGQNLCGIKR